MTRSEGARNGASAPVIARSVSDVAIWAGRRLARLRSEHRLLRLRLAMTKGRGARNDRGNSAHPIDKPKMSVIIVVVNQAAKSNFRPLSIDKEHTYILR